jgi:basic membrane protein A and related proteins
VKISRWMLVAGTAAIVAAVALAGSIGVSKSSAAAKAQFKSALVSDVAGFNDNGFNKNQLVGLKKETAKIHGKYYALVSHSSSDYTPNYNTAVNVDKANIVIAAGFLLSGTMDTYSKAHPGTKFAITDDTASDAGGRKNEEGITYATQEGGCLVGVLAAEMAKHLNGNKAGEIGVVGGIEIPPVDSYIAGYKYCADKAVPGTGIVVEYSNDFVNESACATLAQNEINIQHATVIFQVAGLCGDGALTAAASLGKWGIGVDADEYNVAPGHILTSALKKTDVGVEQAIAGAYSKHWKGGSNILLNLKNNGVGVGKISPAVQSSWKSLMNSYKTKIIKGSLKPPAACKNNKC